MRRSVLFYLAFLFIVTNVEILHSQSSGGFMITPFTHFGSNVSESFGGTNTLYYSAAILSTFLIIRSEVDYRVHNYFWQNKETYDKYTTAALWGGYIAPVAVGGGMYLLGKYNDNQKLYAAGSAVLQAAAIAQTTVSVLKAITGRPNPDPSRFSDMREASRVFQFGFLRGGLHYGWPSGHLAVNSAVVACLMSYYHESALTQILGTLAVVYLIFGVSAHEGATMHWFSDVVAGTVMGWTIGSTVGKDFRQLWDDHIGQDRAAVAGFTPILSVHGTRVGFSVTF